MIHVEFARSLRDVPRDDWDALYAGDVEGYDYCAAIEASGLAGFDLHYLLGYDGGRLAAVMPAFLTDYSLATQLTGAARRAVNALERVAPGLARVRMACGGSPETESCPIGLHPDLDGEERAAAVDALLVGLESLARRLAHPLVALKDVPAPLAAEFGPVFEASGLHRVTGLPTGLLDVDFGSIDEYLARLSPGTRRDMRRKLRARERLEVERRTDLHGLEHEVHALYLETRSRGDWTFEELAPDFFPRVLAALPGRAFCTTYRSGGELVAANLMLVDHGRLVDKFFCMRESARALNPYFLSWFDNVEYCLRHGLRVYHAGQAAYDVKRRLGCRFVPNANFFRHASRLADFALARVAPRLAFELDGVVPEAA